ncbi:MAG: chemotaxis protein CheD [Planctomycetota bacterium]
MSLVTIGMCEMAVSTDTEQTLVTYSLGSCVGVTLFDPEAGVGGMIHCMLPVSKTDPEKAKARPAMFTDTGFVELLNEVLAKGAQMSRLVVKVAGGGAPMDSAGRFKIGERNYAVLRKILWKNNLLIAGEDVGGTKPRTMRIQMTDGTVTVSSGGEVTEL